MNEINMEVGRVFDHSESENYDEKLLAILARIEVDPELQSSPVFEALKQLTPEQLVGAGLSVSRVGYNFIQLCSMAKKKEMEGEALLIIDMIKQGKDKMNIYDRLKLMKEAPMKK